MKVHFKSILALVLICLISTGILAVVNYFTSPVIEANEKETEQKALREVMPQSEGFESIAVSLPDTSSVKAVYRSASGHGYVFRMVVTGYQPNLTVLCGIAADGTITGVQTLSCNETAGYGLQATEAWFTDQYKGKDKNLQDVKPISGATITTKAYRRAIDDAFAAFAILAGGDAQ